MANEDVTLHCYLKQNFELLRRVQRDVTELNRTCPFVSV